MRNGFLSFLPVALLAGAVSAQEITTTPLDDPNIIVIPGDQLDLGDGFQTDQQDEAPLDDLLQELTSTSVEAPREEVAEGPTGVMRVLDKLTGEVIDIELVPGQTARLGFLSITMRECRYPVENPAGDAFIFVDARDLRDDIDVFSGWMIASAPALNAMDHPRYDVWALRCTTS